MLKFQKDEAKETQERKPVKQPSRYFQPEAAAADASISRGGPKCMNCHEFGHLARDCSEPKVSITHTCKMHIIHFVMKDTPNWICLPKPFLTQYGKHMSLYRHEDFATFYTIKLASSTAVAMPCQLHRLQGCL